ncbi:hypothetical protein BpHYR1_051215 [Brachionus plicatilis]|uniref:Uncharacterized protein n=1 Tax=Brachionus plicatilis TaxID=10195 RepID=A0A3M7SXI7_BRAPC|nr:hypothetical protein BpHYR1_051215 [Brachionus plicatilis]
MVCLECDVSMPRINSNNNLVLGDNFNKRCVWMLTWKSSPVNQVTADKDQIAG